MAEKYYNPEQKQRYIDSIDKLGDSLITLQGRYKKLFTNSMEEEEEKEKDLSDFSEKELLDLYACLGIGQPHVLRQVHFDVMNYIKWANIEHWKNIDLKMSDVMQHCSYVKFKNNILTREFLYKALSYAITSEYYTPIKVVIVFAMFEGIGAKDGMEFFKLCKDDLKKEDDKYYAYLCTGRKLEISQELFNLCLECCDATKFAVKNGLSAKPIYYYYEPTNNVYKKRQANSTVETTERTLYIDTSMAIRKACDALNIRRTTGKKLFASGFYEILKRDRPDLLADRRIEGKDAEFIAEISKRYDMTYRVTRTLITDYVDVFG